MKKIQLVAALAAAVGAPVVALGIGTSTASAAPGVQVAAGDHTFGIGDQSQTVPKPSRSRATLRSRSASSAPSRADASQGGSTSSVKATTSLTIGSNVVTGPKSAGNNVVATGGAEVRVNGQHNNVLAVAGEDHGSSRTPRATTS